MPENDKDNHIENSVNNTESNDDSGTQKSSTPSQKASKKLLDILKETSNNSVEKLGWKELDDAPSTFNLETYSKDVCWNCGAKISDKDWCEVCGVPLDSAIKKKILSRTKPLESEKCWRCGGTTSGNICGICGSPLTLKGVEELHKEFQKEKDETQELPFILLLSPKDRQIVKIDIRYSQIWNLVEEYFQIIQSTITAYGPEFLIRKPITNANDNAMYDEFEKSSLLRGNNIRVMFRKIKSSGQSQNLIAMRFFYWEYVDSAARFQFQRLRWKILLLLLTLVTIFTTGWLYIRDVFTLVDINAPIFGTSLLFSIPLLALLLLHELIHLFIQWRKGIILSLPFFIPIPPIPGFLSYLMLGSAGGFLRVINPVRKRDDLFDLFFYPPLFGLLLSAGLFLLGLHFSYIRDQAVIPAESLTEIEQLQSLSPYLLLGSFLEWFANKVGISPPFDPATQIRFIHPLAYAGYVGIILNGLNFLPGSILDGGFLFRSLFNDTLTRIFSFITSIILLFNYNTWALGILTMFVPLSFFHTPITNEVISPHWSRYVLEALALCLAICCIPFPKFLFFP
ncbi:MAG: hypothetical protein U9O98_04710 [Asgard group archaeon]|nr:hypothetical protein [Asgard group archaeon]